MTKTLAVGLLAAVLGLFGGLAMHNASAEPPQRAHTSCEWFGLHGDKPLTANDLYYSHLTCDTDYS